MHSPKYSDAEKKAWRQRGQMAMKKLSLASFPACDFSTEQGCRRVLELAGDAVLKGRLPNSSATALAKLASVGLKAAELGVARRVAALEAAARAREKAQAVSSSHPAGRRRP
jgi:hypothetical protein